MSKVEDSGHFIFNKERSPLRERMNQNPSKPDNMRRESINKNTGIPDSLYTYSMGISQIEAKNNSYEEENIYVSKPIKINENVLEVSLDALEEHPVFDEVSGRTSKQQTSVEYYISIDEKPSLNDWIPILPKNIDKVKSERLFFEGITAKTLFSFRMNTIEVYRDGLKLNGSDYNILNNQQIQIENVDTSRIYTVNYSPNTYTNDPYRISINDYKYKTERIEEEFPRGTDINKSIKLKHVPYIDREQLLKEENFNPNTSNYKPVEVYIKDASIRDGLGGSTNYVPAKKPKDDNMPYMNNKTLYLDNSWSRMKPFNLEEPYLGLDYYQYKDKITFASHINIPMIEENEHETPGTGTIVVSYDAIITEFRLKIILRRNTQKEITATPRVKEYSVRLKSIR